LARKILLADDSVTAQNMGRKILTDAGYEVVTVNNGSAALKKILEYKPSVVVLDVYMPGYSGLEVCARIKEGRDTEGIPVLLTVGKLEPFRQEDARKVHADAFIIKPFEATELLSALGRLEAKAGSQQSEPSPAEPAKAPPETKSSKHVAATMARYEREVADGVPKFGDQESGWKARLTMPSPGTKHGEPEQEPEITTVASRGLQDWQREPGDRPAFVVSAPVADATGSFPGLPNDVTPDELAAIAAAAAAVGGKNEDAEVEGVPAGADISAPQSTAPATFATEPVPEAETVYPISTSSAGPVSAQVEAVFTSFAAARATDLEESTANVPGVAKEALAGGSASNLVPMPARWVAEEVPVQASESALVLEQEMQKAFAAFAAAENSAAYEPGPVDKRDEPIFASSAPPAIGGPTPFASSGNTSGESAPATESQSASATPVPMVGEKSVQGEITKPPATPFTPIAAEEPKHALVAFGEPHPFGAADPSAPENATVEPGEAAALSHELASSTASAESLPDDWHDLRQPVASAAPSNNDGKTALERFGPAQEAPTGDGANQTEPAAMAAAASGDSSASSSADNTLSSIVDNMLAELKPKLMAELAKKLEKK
jgi:CheY-like chemotaxis protein